MARRTTVLYEHHSSISYTGGYTAPAGTGVGKLRVMQIHFANGDAATQVAGFLAFSVTTWGSGVELIPQFSMPSKTTKTFNLSVPLLAGEGFKVYLGSDNMNVTVIGEETD